MIPCATCCRCQDMYDREGTTSDEGEGELEGESEGEGKGEGTLLDGDVVDNKAAAPPKPARPAARPARPPRPSAAAASVNGNSAAAQTQLQRPSPAAATSPQSLDVARYTSATDDLSFEKGGPRPMRPPPPPSSAAKPAPTTGSGGGGGGIPPARPPMARSRGDCDGIAAAVAPRPKQALADPHSASRLAEGPPSDEAISMPFNITHETHANASPNGAVTVTQPQRKIQRGSVRGSMLIPPAAASGAGVGASSGSGRPAGPKPSRPQRPPSLSTGSGSLNAAVDAAPVAPQRSIASLRANDVRGGP